MAQIVDAFEKRKKNDGCKRSNCDMMMLDCEMEIKGIVKKVVKVSLIVFC